MAAEQGASSSITLLAVEELETLAAKYIESMEGLCQKKEELAKKTMQEELKVVEADKEMLNALKNTVSTVAYDMRAHDAQINECREEMKSLENEIIEYRRRRIRNENRVSTILELTDHIIVVDEVIQGIIHGKVTEEVFLKNLDILHDKIGYLRNTDENRHWHKSPQCRVMCIILERLRSIAISKVAKYVFEYALKFFHGLITECERPKDLDMFHKYYQFIMLNEPKLTKKLVNKYLKSKKALYTSYFRSLDKEVEEICDSKKFIERDTQKINNIYMATDSSDQDELKVEAYFKIGGRTALLLDLTEPEVPEDDNYYFEHLFKNFHIELLEMIHRENGFLETCFLLNHEERSNFIHKMMEKTITFLSYSWKKYISPMNDPVTSLLCFYLVLRFRSLSHLNEIKTVDQYWDTLERILINRFSNTIQLNVHSIDNYDATKYDFDFRAHYIVTRYAKFTADVMRIHKLYPQPVIADLLKILRISINEFCVRVAKSIPHKEKEMVFLINCYQEIIDAMAEMFSNDYKDDVKEYLEQLPGLSTEYNRALIQLYYGDMMEYLQEVEIFAPAEKNARMKQYAPMAKLIIEKFNANWQEDLDRIHKNVLMSFNNFITALDILKGTFRVYFNVISRFSDAVTKSAKKDLVDITTIAVELEQHRREDQDLEDIL